MARLRKITVSTLFTAAAVGGWLTLHNAYQDLKDTTVAEGQNARAAMTELLPHIIRMRHEMEQPGNPHRMLWRETSDAIQNAQNIVIRPYVDIIAECHALWALQGINIQTGEQHRLSRAGVSAHKACGPYIFNFH